MTLTATPQRPSRSNEAAHESVQQAEDRTGDRPWAQGGACSLSEGGLFSCSEAGSKR